MSELSLFDPAPRVQEPIQASTSLRNAEGRMAGGSVESPAGSGVQYIEVLLFLETKALEARVFTYAVPEEFQDLIAVGSPVAVPFAKMGTVTGVVVGVNPDISDMS